MTPVAADKKNLQTRYVTAGDQLVIYMRHGKRSINVASSFKSGGSKKAVTGARQSFSEDDKTNGDNASPNERAMAAYLKLKDDAHTKGWTEKTRPTAKPREKKDRDAFKAIPPPGMKIETPAAPPKAAPTASKKSKSKGKK